MTEHRNPDEAPVAPEQPVTLNRRRALKTLGLAAGTACTHSLVPAWRFRQGQG